MKTPTIVKTVKSTWIQYAVEGDPEVHQMTYPRTLNPREMTAAARDRYNEIYETNITGHKIVIQDYAYGAKTYKIDTETFLDIADTLDDKDDDEDPFEDDSTVPPDMIK